MPTAGVSLQHASGTYFSMTKSLDRTASALSSSTLKSTVSVLYDAFGESLVPYIRLEPSSQSSAMLDLCL